MLYHHLWHSSNIEPTLCQGIELPVFPAKMRPLATVVLQLSHDRRWWASSKLALGEHLLRPIYCYDNAGLMFAQCCKRWATIRLTLCQWLEFADQLWPQPSRHEALTQCCYNAGPPSSTSAQHENNIGSMPRDSWVGGYECQQSVAGGLHFLSPLSASLDTTVLCYAI